VYWDGSCPNLNLGLFLQKINQKHIWIIIKAMIGPTIAAAIRMADTLVDLTNRIAGGGGARR
jgi:hypothetical protein